MARRRGGRGGRLLAAAGTLLLGAAGRGAAGGQEFAFEALEGEHLDGRGGRRGLQDTVQLRCGASYWYEGDPSTPAEGVQDNAGYWVRARRRREPPGGGGLTRAGPPHHENRSSSPSTPPTARRPRWP